MKGRRNFSVVPWRLNAALETFYEVHLTVAFTHEEKQIITQRGLLKTKLLDRRPADAKNDARDEKFELHVQDLMDGKTDRFLCATPSKSKIYEEGLLDAMQQMKLWLSDNAETRHTLHRENGVCFEASFMRLGEIAPSKLQIIQPVGEGLHRLLDSDAGYCDTHMARQGLQKLPILITVGI